MMAYTGEDVIKHLEDARLKVTDTWRKNYLRQNKNS